MTEEAVKRIVKETISELKRQGLIRTNIVAEVLEILSAYYLEGEEDEQITEALKKIEGDPYYDIITLYFEAGDTWEMIAERFGVERCTIFRNRKRLFTQLYDELEK